jgi:C1A family cysteine protease
MDNAFKFAEGTAVATEDSYSYTGSDGSCKSSFTTAIPQGGVTGYKDVSNSADSLKSAIEGSPVSVAIEADQSAFQMYSGGVITSGCGSNLDHGVLAVGINSDGSIKVKNSWGSSWGVNGFVNIATSQCGITTSASYPTVSGEALASTADDYTAEWEEFQAANGARNGDIPAAFKANVDRVKEHNAKGDTYTMSYTGPFADLTAEEFAQLNIRGFKKGSESGLPSLGMHEGTYSGATVDWTTKGAVTQVKNQGQCGSCWAFSTTGGLEGQWQIATGNLVSMSEQQFVDCDKVDSGCNGGLMDNGFKFAEGTAVATEDSYSYTGRDGSCKSSFTTAIPQGGVTGYKDVSNSADSLKSAIEGSPVSVAIEADQSAFQMYSGGVITSGCGSNLDHGVLAVGINSDGSIKVKNSWGSSWGVNGFVNIATSQCGITTSASYPTVSGTVEV